MSSSGRQQNQQQQQQQQPQQKFFARKSQPPPPTYSPPGTPPPPPPPPTSPPPPSLPHSSSPPFPRHEAAEQDSSTNGAKRQTAQGSRMKKINKSKISSNFVHDEQMDTDADNTTQESIPPPHSSDQSSQLDDLLDELEASNSTSSSGEKSSDLKRNEANEKSGAAAAKKPFTYLKKRGGKKASDRGNKASASAHEDSVPPPAVAGSRKSSGKKPLGRIPKLLKFPLPPTQAELVDSQQDPQNSSQSSSSVDISTRRDNNPTQDPESQGLPTSQGNSSSSRYPSSSSSSSFAGSQGNQPAATIVANTSDSSSSFSSAVPDSARGTYGTNRPHHSQSSICLDITSHKFVPDDQKRVLIVFRKMLGNPIDMPDLSYTSSSGNVITHDFPEVSSDSITGVPLHKAPGATISTNSKQFLLLNDFATPPAGNTAPKLLSVPRKDFIPLVLVSRHTSAVYGAHWECPGNDLAKDFINDMLCRMFSEDKDCAAVYERTGKWGLLTIVYIASINRAHLDDFRRVLAEEAYKDYYFDSFPKDALTLKTDVSILLRGSMKAWKTECIPKVLFKRNQNDLAGKIRVSSSHLFAQGETSHKGESKADWRRVDLEADDQFLRCLRAFPESKPFSLGVDAVQIRGGLRPPEAGSPKPILGKRQWVPAPQPLFPPLLLPTHPSSSSSSLHLPTLPLYPLQPEQIQATHFFNPVDNRQSGRGGKRGRGTKRGRGKTQ